MGARQDTVARRLDRLLRELRRNPPALLVQFEKQLPDGWENTRGRFLAAELALDSNLSHSNDLPLAIAFAAAGLNPQNPFHWRILLECFARAHFSRFKSGKPRTEPKIVAAVREDLGKLPTNLSDSETAKLLKEKFPKKYTVAVRILRAYIGKARKPDQSVVTPQRDISEIVKAIKSEIDLQALMTHSATATCKRTVFSGQISNEAARSIEQHSWV